MDTKYGLVIIHNRLIMMLKVLESDHPHNALPDKYSLLESYNHDIHDCLYWLRNEREKDE
jgi:hypothetical protein